MSMQSNDPRIVAIETSGREGSVAVAIGPTLLDQRVLPATVRHAGALMPAIQDLVIASGWKPSDIDHVYLSLGPGSFTGLRIAVAVARALAQALGCKLVGVPSLEVLAANAPDSAAVVVPILDAKRGQVFAARFERINNMLVETVPAALVEPAAFIHAALDRADQIAPGAQVALTGEGVAFHRPALFSDPRAPTHLIELPADQWPGRAATVHKLGWQRAQSALFADPAHLLPIYIRLPEAEEVYRKKHGPPADPALAPKNSAP